MCSKNYLHSKPTKVQSTTPCYKRFKGIESFLRKVAFNLGNSPSQTEVKIISCIPVDVSDLQQKIICLEKELAEARGTKVTYNVLSVEKRLNQGQAPNSQTDNKGPNTSEVYNALLVEGPSSKRASGRPYETNRYYEVQHEYECTNPYQRHSEQPVTSREDFTRLSTSKQPYGTSRQKNVNQSGTTKRKSNTSFLVDYHSKKEEFSTKSTFGSNATASICQVLGGHPNYSQESVQCENRRLSKIDNHQKSNNYKKKKRMKRKKQRTQYVYYAENYGSPFMSQNNSPLISEDKFDGTTIKKAEEELMPRDYLATMIKRQYKPHTLGNTLSVISGITSPICRDTMSQADLVVYESNVCSCCEGPFQNIDHLVNNRQKYMHNQQMDSNVYYDSNFYDLIPVKEQSIKFRDVTSTLNKKNNKLENGNQFGTTRFKDKINFSPIAYPNDISAYPNNYYTSPENMEQYVKTMSTQAKKKDIAKRARSKKTSSSKYTEHCGFNFETYCERKFRKPKIEYFETSRVYPKKLYSKPYIKTTVKKKSKCVGPTQLYKNAECTTTPVNCNECQTINSNEDINRPDKTDVTINQIKDILQSVLAEVRVKKGAKNQPDEQANKNRVLQKKISQYNLRETGFSKSVHYNPDCSPFMAPNLNPTPLLYTESPMKCIQNLPILIHNPGQRICGCCPSNFYSKTVSMKPAATAATNTEVMNDVGRKETERLIHEIYKSIALTLKESNKDATASKNVESKKSLNNKIEPNKATPKVFEVFHAVSDMILKKKKSNSTDTHNTTYVVSNSRSELAMDTDTEKQIGNERSENTSDRQSSKPEYVDDMDSQSQQTLEDEASATRSVLTSCETESVSTLMLPPYRGKYNEKKSGMFAKFISVFKSKEKPMIKEINLVSGDSSYESGGYRYEVVQKPRSKLTNNLPKLRTHIPEQFRRTPYTDRQSHHKEEMSYTILYSGTSEAPYFNDCEVMSTAKPRKQIIRNVNSVVGLRLAKVKQFKEGWGLKIERKGKWQKRSTSE